MPGTAAIIAEHSTEVEAIVDFPGAVSGDFPFCFKPMEQVLSCQSLGCHAQAKFAVSIYTCFEVHVHAHDIVHDFVLCIPLSCESGMLYV